MPSKIDVTQEEAWQGSAGDAIDYALGHVVALGDSYALEFLDEWRLDRALSWPGYKKWLDAQYRHRLASQTSPASGEVGDLFARLNTFTTCGCGDEDWPQLRHDLADTITALQGTVERLEADRAALREALEPLSLLAADEDNPGANMNDPLFKWFTIAQLIAARTALDTARKEEA